MKVHPHFPNQVMAWILLLLLLLQLLLGYYYYYYYYYYHFNSSNADQFVLFFQNTNSMRNYQTPFTCIARTHVDIHITNAHRDGLGLRTGPSEQKGLELGFEFRHSGKISQTDRQQIPDRWSEETERALTKSFKLTFRMLKKKN